MFVTFLMGALAALFLVAVLGAAVALCSRFTDIEPIERLRAVLTTDVAERLVVATALIALAWMLAAEPQAAVSLAEAACAPR